MVERNALYAERSFFDLERVFVKQRRVRFCGKRAYTHTSVVNYVGFAYSGVRCRNVVFCGNNVYDLGGNYISVVVGESCVCHDKLVFVVDRDVANVFVLADFLLDVESRPIAFLGYRLTVTYVQSA